MPRSNAEVSVKVMDLPEVKAVLARMEVVVEAARAVLNLYPPTDRFIAATLELREALDLLDEDTDHGARLPYRFPDLTEALVSERHRRRYLMDASFHRQVDVLARLLPSWIDGLADESEEDQRALRIQEFPA